MKQIISFSLYVIPFFMLIIAAIEALRFDTEPHYGIITFEFIGALCVAVLAYREFRNKPKQ